MRFFSDKSRPVHLGPYPLERLARSKTLLDWDAIPRMQPLDFDSSATAHSIVKAIGEYQALLDAIRDGLINTAPSVCPDDEQARADHLKSFGYFGDASQVGVCKLPDAALLRSSIHNPAIDVLADTLRTQQTKTLAAGIDMIMADLKDSMEAPPTTIIGHTHAIVLLYEWPRDPGTAEAGCAWIQDAQPHRASLRASETAVVIANYLRTLGHDARAHSASCTDIDLNVATVAAGLASVEEGKLVNPYLGMRFGVAVVTTTFGMAADRPLLPQAQQPRWHTHGPAWWLGIGFAKSALHDDPYAKRKYVDGPHPFETLERVDIPTTYIDEPNVARVPKRADMFARAQFGDMGKAVQEKARAGYYVRKAAPSSAQRRALGACVPFQDGAVNTHADAGLDDPQTNTDMVKATAYFLGVDAVGVSRCPDWAWYSHDALGEPIEPPHDQAISMIIDQGYETMEGASGDDWISVAQSMRAYLRFAVLGGVLARHLRSLGYSARSHTVLDGEVLQPPLLLLSGLGEVSRIGEVILNPFLGPRLKSGVVTTNLPMAHDKPIDFGLQRFCEQCNKCARECPSGAITAGPKLMFNGYEIWKSDSQKCATYRLSTEGGAMCGRCMKTCPWNLEGLFAEKSFRYLAMKLPQMAPVLAKLDDAMGNGGLNLTKKWWWDLELDGKGGYRPTTHPLNERTLQKDLHLKYEEQTLAVYPAPLAPHPWPYPFAMEREKGIAAYESMVSAHDYREKLANGDTAVIHRYIANKTSPVQRVVVRGVTRMSNSVSVYELAALDGSSLPAWQAGAHIDVVVAPEYLRPYSLTGDPHDRSCYRIGVLKESAGRGGSALMHRIFQPGRMVFISHPVNHFPLIEEACFSLLLGGGIGITPMIAMAHRLHRLGRDFQLHYSIKQRDSAGFVDELQQSPWRDKVQLHVSNEGTRIDLPAVLQSIPQGAQVYTCGPDVYMNAVLASAAAAGIADEACHSEHFSVPELPEWENHAFTLQLQRSGKQLQVPADKSAATVLNEHGYGIDIKCSDGLCGVCQCTLLDGKVQHRDFVLSARQRAHTIILCQSRSADKSGVVTIDL